MKKHNIKMAKTLDECNAITHDGVFHGDDVFAAAILSLVGPVTLLRTRDYSTISEKTFDGNVIIFDVGEQYEPALSLFDHHQSDFTRARDDGTLYSSAGLLWEAYSGLILHNVYECSEEMIPEVADRVDRCLIKGIDARDNGQAHDDSMSVSGYMSLLNPRWDYDIDPNDRFIAAAYEAKKILDLAIINAISIEKGKRLVKEAVENNHGDPEVLVLPKFVGGWQSQIMNMDSEAAKQLKFVVYRATGADQYNAQAIQIGSHVDEFGSKKAYRLLFPEEWRGVRMKRLAKTTGVRSVLYCHKEGYLAAASTEKGAIELAKLAIASATPLESS